MEKSTNEAKSVLDELIQQAVEAELAAMLEQYSNVQSIDGRRAVVRNGYLPEREIVTTIDSVKVKVPKGRAHSGSGIHFNSAIVPPYVRKSAALPWLYLRGISTGDMSEALGIMLGDEVRRYVAKHGEPAQGAVMIRTASACCGIIGVTPEGEKERVAIGAGYRELKESWCELLLDLKKRGLPAGPLRRVRRRRNGLLVGDRGSVPADEASSLLVSQDG